MKLLLTGAGGQLGREIINIAKRQSDVELHPLSRRELDVTNRSQVIRTVMTIKPDVIINASAYTSVDQAETDTEDALTVNAHGSQYIAEAAQEYNCKMCHISTDYVFDGRSTRPYEENDPVNPISVYGHSKALGEKYVRQICEKHFIVRTSWLYSAYGANFVHTMLRLGNDPGVESVRVVNDQTGSPTWTFDFACFLLQLIQTEYYGTYHVSNSGSTTWYEFTKEIFRLASIAKPVVPVQTSEFPRPARRPAYSVLGSKKSWSKDFNHFDHGMML
ncbi:dTDP-4-dehydrorhamnose reductase [Alicyclobacillus fastidiosus]|uniref:dTDP-4-dehydrorhamnose reductase n=1 Tax=Alicyclobacillus fastidiosus TaxID=392011 RepID=UPI0023E8FF21|nr:dTDP-4-dehydrorhamnose reductase [Alicyclobacillus fastidiosus]GMA60054.1 NAD(P)-dependent oxidoreductase [Alicyclobacillus fastidiosus]